MQPSSTPSSSRECPAPHCLSWRAVSSQHPHLLVESLLGPEIFIARTSPFRGIDDLFVTFIAPVQRARNRCSAAVLVGWALPDPALCALAFGDPRALGHRADARLGRSTRTGGRRGRDGRHGRRDHDQRETGGVPEHRLVWSRPMPALARRAGGSRPPRPRALARSRRGSTSRSRRTTPARAAAT